MIKLCGNIIQTHWLKFKPTTERFFFVMCCAVTVFVLIFTQTCMNSGKDGININEYVKKMEKS